MYSVLIQAAKSGKDIAFLVPLANSDAKGTSALMIASNGNQRIVHSLRLAELGEVFVYETAFVSARDVREANVVQALPVLAAKK